MTFKYPPKDRDAWEVQRRLVLDRAKGQCERCRQRKGEHVHHLKYSDVIGHEPLDWLQLVCLRCHGEYHPRHTFRSMAEQRRIAAERRKVQAYTAGKQKTTPCAHCGGTYPKAQHKAICVRFGLHRKGATPAPAAPG